LTRSPRAAAKGSGQLHIVAVCTKQKSVPVPRELRYGSLSGTSLNARFAGWWKAINSIRGERFKANELYQGQYWSVVRELPAAAGGAAALWVASAGYGLIRANTPLLPYSATFVKGEPDSIAPADCRPWWRLLTAKPLPESAPARSIAEIAKSDPRATILVIASPAYVAVLEEDLAAARGALRDGSRLLIVSSRDRSIPSTLIQNLIPSEAPLATVFGGSLASLHARTAHKILTENAPDALRSDVLRPCYAELLETLAPPLRQQRRHITDPEVLHFIRESLAKEPRLSHTKALKSLRESGLACEQARFRELFRSAGEAVDVA
jgi:hypothetical protein